MHAALFRELVRFLAGLEPIQCELEAVYAERLLALASADAAQLNALATSESQLQEKLRRHLQQRGRILADARRHGFTAHNLQLLLAELQSSGESQIPDEQLAQAAAWMKQIEQRSWKLRRDSWVNWTVVTRSSRQCQEMRHIIATAGEQRAAGSLDDRRTVGGGTLLDAKV
ncbi:MAG: hypothetical protein ACYTGL_10410 [Planctomycetota bacterium]|jgi:hypothetical protein